PRFRPLATPDFTVAFRGLADLFCSMVKSAEQQSQLMLHRTRDLLMRQRTQVINALQAHLAELGITAAQGTAGLKQLLKIIANNEEERLPVDAHASVVVLAAELQAMQTLIGSIEKRIMAQHRQRMVSCRVPQLQGHAVGAKRKLRGSGAKSR